MGSTPNATGKWKFIAKEQGGGWWMEILRGNIRGKKGFWLNRPYRILAEWSDITWRGRWRRMRNPISFEGDRISRMGPNQIRRIFAKAGK